LLGDLSMSQGDANKACQLYKSALELASSAIVSGIDSISE